MFNHQETAALKGDPTKVMKVAKGKPTAFSHGDQAIDFPKGPTCKQSASSSKDNFNKQGLDPVNVT